MNPANLLLVLALTCGAVNGSEEISVESPDGRPLMVRAALIRRDPSGTISARGDVELRHGAVTVKCTGYATVFLSGGVFSAFEAFGIIEATAANKTFTGDHLYYDEARRLLSLSGKPRAREGNVLYSADEKILCYTETGVMKFEPAARIVVDKARVRRLKEGKRKKFLGIF